MEANISAKLLIIIDKLKSIEDRLIRIENRLSRIENTSEHDSEEDEILLFKPQIKHSHLS